MTQTRKWTLLTALLIVAMLAAGWFLLVSPKRADVVALRAQTQSQTDANAALELQIAQLKAQAVKLPEQRARLAEIRTSVPDSPRLPTLIRNLTGASRRAGADLRSVAPGQPAAAVPNAVSAQATPVPQPTGGTAAAPAPATAAAAAPAQLEFIPLTIGVEGTFVELKQLLDELEELDRAFLVTGMTVDSEYDAATGDTKTTADVQGRVFFSRPAAGAPTTAPTTAQTTASTTGSGR